MSDWTTEKPTVRGQYWLSVAPAMRGGMYSFRPVVKCYAWPPDGNVNIETTAGYVYFKLSDPCLKGAQWKLVDPDPADPFAEPPLSYSQDNDLP